MKKCLINKFRDGIFLLNTRRFGKIAEIMIKKSYNYDWAGSNDYDLYDTTHQIRVEVKFSTVLKKTTVPLDENNVMTEVLNISPSDRLVLFSQCQDVQYNCNIEQVKKYLFDILYYGLFFYDKICIFCLPKNDINPQKCPGWCESQHRGNVKEGQFHITNRNIQIHMRQLVKTISYEELFDMLNPFGKLCPLLCQMIKRKLKK